MNNPKCLSTSLPVNTINSNNIICNNMKPFDIRHDIRSNKL